jgi:hypothetical protein
MMNAKNQNQCSVPEDKISIHCMGLIEEVSKPELQSSGCFLSVVVDCPKEQAVLSGMIQSYVYVSPDHALGPVSPEEAVFSDVTVSAK